MENDIKVLNDLNWGYRAARVLHVANNMGIFTILSERNMSSEQISEKCQTKPELTEKLLIACTAMGLLEKDGGLYENSELAKKYLVRGGKLYQGDIIAHSAFVWDFWSDLDNEIRLEDRHKGEQADEHRNFIMGMNNIAVAGRTQMFVDNIELSDRGKLLDVGGGPGSYSIAACKRYPQLKAVVFDLPETVSITKQIIADEGMEDRVTVQEANWETDNFGKDNDVVLLSNVLHGPGSNAELKLRKSYTSMESGGLLVVQDFLLNDEKSSPLIPALFNIMVGTYSVADLLSLIEKAGFVNAEIAAASEKFGCSWITAKKVY
jgi:hypothetical protein